MSGPRNENGFRHLLRVRLGVNGARGKLMHCKRDTPNPFWKVKLDTGEWAEPRALIIDGKGEHVSRCHDCGMDFMSERPNETLCPECDSLAFGTLARVNEPSGPSLATRRYWQEHKR